MEKSPCVMGKKTFITGQFHTGVTGTGGTGGPPVHLTQGKLFFTRRNLPHCEIDGNTYFITYRCASGTGLNEPARTIVMDNWKYWHGKHYLLHAVVVMPDHVHVMITPKRKEDGDWFTLGKILHTNKGFTAHEINKAMNRSGQFWQDERFDRMMRNGRYTGQRPVPLEHLST